MEVDGMSQTKGCLLKPGDADAGNPEQYYLPAQLGWFERRIEHVRGRDGPCQWWREMEDRTASPIRRDDDAADPDVFDPEPAGIDHDLVFASADTHYLEGKTGNDRLFIAHSE